MVAGTDGSFGMLVFLSNSLFQRWARSRDFGLEVLATIMHPETCLVYRGWKVVDAFIFEPWSHSWTLTFRPSIRRILREKSALAPNPGS